VKNLKFLCSLEKKNFINYLLLQKRNFFPDNLEIKKDIIENAFSGAIKRYQFCAAHINNKYFRVDDSVILNHLHADQYCMFLYFLSNEFFINGEIAAAERFYFLNRALNSVDIFYEVELPKVFLLGHPIGTVLGRANYGDFFRVSQGCTVGNNHGIYPVIGKGVAMYANSSIIGNSNIGDYNHISANTTIIDRNTPEDRVIFKELGSIKSKPVKNRASQMYFFDLNPTISVEKF